MMMFIYNLYLPLTTTSFSSGGVSMSVVEGVWKVTLVLVKSGGYWPLLAASPPQRTLAHDFAHNTSRHYTTAPWADMVLVLAFSASHSIHR